MSSVLKGLNEGRSYGRDSWDSNMPGYQGDYGGAENFGRRKREWDEDDRIDARIRAEYEKKKEYEQHGKFWLKLKDSQRHLPAGPFVGKQSANQAAIDLLKQQPELKGNLVITAYGPDEQVNELSNNTLASYKKKAGADASRADKEGNYKRGDKRFSGIVRATKKEFNNDAKGLAEGVNHPALQGWDLMDKNQKRHALANASIMSTYDSSDKSSYELDDILHAARVKAQNQEDELSMGAGGRRELQRQAKQDFEAQRQQLFKEKMEMERFAWEKANTEAERKHEVNKIEKEYLHELRKLQMEHEQDMQKILHADTHELNKMKAEFNMRQKEREQVKPQQKPEPEETDDENFDQDTGAPLKPPQSNQWHTSQQVGYTPTKPSKPNKNDDVTDVEPKPNKPLALGNSLKEAASMLKVGDEILWKPLNAKMVHIPATVIAVDAEKLKIKIYSPRMIKMRNGNDTMVVDLAGSEIIPKQTTTESTIQAGRQVDAKGRTQAQWVDLVMKKFPNARIAQGKGPFSKTTATLPGGRQIVWTPTMPDTINAVSKPKMSESTDNPYGYRKGQTVKLDNGQQGRVIDIFDDSIEVLLVGGRTVTVDFRDAQVIDENAVAEDQLDELKCWSGYTRVQGVPAGAPGSCKKKTNEEGVAEGQEEKCPHCGGAMFSEMIMNEKKDACYYKVKSRYKVWPSAYASGALVKCRKSGADSWGDGGKKNESSILEGIEQVDENLNKWFKEKWVRFGPDGKIRGDCARGDDSEGKPKCLPQSKAQNLGKEGRASAASRKRREDPNPERSGKAINVNTKKK
jgi:preprotein translocase subunit YajC